MMNKPDVQIMDIYPDVLTTEYSVCEAILTEDYGYTENQFFREFDERLKEYGLDNLNNKLVGIMFEVTKDMILQKKPEAEIDYSVNGHCNDFWINGEQQ